MTSFSVILQRTPYWRCLNDLAKALALALRAAGHEATVFPDFARNNSTEIMLGAHNRLTELPDYPVIIYQTELPGSMWWTPNYLARLNSARAVWDAVPGLNYELAPNVRRGVIEPGLYNFARQPTIGSVLAGEFRPVPKDIDLLFYGSLSPRRIELLTKLFDAGLGIDVHFNVFGDERNALIDRAKVVVDIKQGEGDPDDTTRTFFLDSRGACVLSENDPGPAGLRPSEIVEQCRALLLDPVKRELHTERRRAKLKPTDATAALAVLEGPTVHARPHPLSAFPI